MSRRQLSNRGKVMLMQRITFIKAEVKNRHVHLKEQNLVEKREEIQEGRTCGIVSHRRCLKLTLPAMGK